MAASSTGSSKNRAKSASGASSAPATRKPPSGAESSTAPSATKMQQGSASGPLGEPSNSFKLIKRLFPLVEWTEEFRIDLMLLGYVLPQLFTQLHNIYRFNIHNYNVTVVVLCCTVLCKRAFFTVGRSLFAELRQGRSESSGEQRVSSAGTALKLCVFTAYCSYSVYLLATLYQSRAEQSDGAVRVLVFVAPFVVDTLLLSLQSDPRVARGGRAGGGAEGIEELTEAQCSARVLSSLKLALFTSSECAYVAGFLPLFFADEEIYYYDTRHCNLMSMYFFFNCLTLLLGHSLATSVTDFHLWELAHPDAKAVSTVPRSMSVNCDKIYLVITFARIFVLAILIIQMIDPTHWLCFSTLLLCDYWAFKQFVRLWEAGRWQRRQALKDAEVSSP